MTTATIHQSNDQETSHVVDGFTHTVTLNDVVIYQGWSKAKAELFTETISKAIHDAGQSQLEHCNAQLQQRAAKMVGLSSGMVQRENWS